MMNEAAILFPNQLFEEVPFTEKLKLFLLEEPLFFLQYRFHKQKIAFHRASMKCYADYLSTKGYEVEYIDSFHEFADVRKLLKHLKGLNVHSIHLYDPVDDWLHERIVRFDRQFEIVWYSNMLFLEADEKVSAYFSNTEKVFFQTDFYKMQRRRLNILMEAGNPVGGKWSYDDENRKKYPRKQTPPDISFPELDAYWQEAVTYTTKHFSHHYGTLTARPIYPYTFSAAKTWLDDFFKHRFHDFGIYEDSITARAHFLHHSVLTPVLNVGLLRVKDVLAYSLKYARSNNIPINSLEGFIRQLIGWREFIKGVYMAIGVKQRTSNFWGHQRKIPASFYDGTTGILPLDMTIRKLLATGYVHHIERLMVLAGFMNLCEFHPDEVYRWFMEMFIDAYDWVMVSNVYGMSLFADGGLMSTKPYISGSNYLKKMSDYATGEWQEVWDGLFWNFINNHIDFFGSQPRLSMMVSTWHKMSPDRREKHIIVANNFLMGLD